MLQIGLSFPVLLGLNLNIEAGKRVNILGLISVCHRYRLDIVLVLRWLFMLPTQVSLKLNGGEAFGLDETHTRTGLLRRNMMVESLERLAALLRSVDILHLTDS